MVPITATDAITPAIEHTRRQLFQRFRLGQWTKMAFVGLLAGELGGNGCGNSYSDFSRHAGAAHGLPGSLGIDPALIAAFITTGVVAAFAIGIIFLYIGSVMRFVLFDSIVTRECRIRWSWSRRLGAGWRYFVWKLLYVLLALAGVAILVGIPVAVAFAHGWFKEPKEHLPALISGGVIVFLMFFVFFVATALILVLTKDFVIPQMALDDVDVMEGWRRLWIMMKADQGAYIGYIAMKIVLAIVVGILIGFASLIVGLIFAVPTVGLGVFALIMGKTAGLVWNAYTITVAAVVGCVLLGIFLYLISLIAVPAIVFFPAYAMYFFAGRYPRLSEVLYSGQLPAAAGRQPAAHGQQSVPHNS
jgi:hypothetical protein